MNSRVIHTIGLILSRGGRRRGDYLRKHNVMRSVGYNVDFMPRKVPLYPKLISMGNNVMVASGVRFLTHDSINRILNESSKEMPDNLKHSFKENIGCIRIGDNVFIGADAQICANVSIGKNVIITSNSVVVKDIPSGSVVRGNPAKIVCKYEDFYKSRIVKESFEDGFNLVMGTNVDSSLADYMWEKFEKEH